MRAIFDAQALMWKRLPCRGAIAAENAGVSPPVRTLRHFHHRMRSLASFSVMAALSLLASVALAGDRAPRRVTFAPHWLPQAQFAGYYVALDRGMYAAAGMDVTILLGGPDHPPSRLLADGTADVASLWLTTALQMRDRGIPVVNVAQLFRRSSLMLVAKRSSGIHRPEDLSGRRIGVWDGDFLLQPMAFFQRYGVDADLVPLGSTINLFLRDGVDVTVATWFNEFHTILNTGLEPGELTTFSFHEHGLNFPEDGLYCRQDTLDRDPDLCRDFARVSLAGWSHAFAHPDEAVALTMRHMLEAHLGTNAAHQRWMLARVQDLMVAGDAARPPGSLDPTDYERTARTLQENGWISSVPAFPDFHRALVAAP